MRWMFALVGLLLAFPALSVSFQTSFFMRLTTPDGSVMETTSRQLMPAGKPEDQRWREDGLTFTIEDAKTPGMFALTARMMKRHRTDTGLEWREAARGHIEAPLAEPVDWEFAEGGYQLEMELFITRQDRQTTSP